MIKEQFYINIGSAGSFAANSSKSKISDKDMDLKKVVERVFKEKYAYGFRYSKIEEIVANGKSYYAEEEELPFNFIDPISIAECSINQGFYKITVRNSWATYYCSKEDNIVFTSDEISNNFKEECKSPLKIIRMSND